MENTTYQKWLAQLRKGYLELCVLVILQRKDSPSVGGHPRLYYRFSDEGAELLPQMLETYQSNQKAVDKLKELT